MSYRYTINIVNVNALPFWYICLPYASDLFDGFAIDQHSHQFAAHLAAAGFQTGVDHKSLFAVPDNLRSV